MPLPSSGSISLSQVNVELGKSATATISLNDSDVRALFGVPGSGTTISKSQGFGKANQFAFTISSNQSNANLRTLAINAGWNQTSRVVATIDSGVTISSTSTGSYALTINGSFPGGVELINNGIILGRGGDGGNGGGVSTTGTAGGNGGPGLLASVAVSITNNNRISGGGGGGGGGALNSYNCQQYCTEFDGCGTSCANAAGGGGGGGIGVSSGGTGGNIPGGSALSGTGGTLTTAGTGGSGRGDAANELYSATTGGNGGSFGASGSVGGGGGSSGGAGGAAVVGNANITWVATGTRNGAINS